MESMLPRRGRGLGPGRMAGRQGRREMDRYAQRQAIMRKRAGIWTVSNMLLIESSGKTTKIEGRARRYQSRLYMWIPRAVESSWNPHRLSTLGSSYIARNRERHIGHMRVLRGSFIKAADFMPNNCDGAEEGPQMPWKEFARS